MGVPNDLPALVNPSATDPMNNPSHALSEHTEENNAVMALARMWRTRSGTDLPIVNLRSVAVGTTYAPGDGSDQSTYVQAAVDLLPYYGGVILCPPGAYGLGTGINITNKGAVYFMGLTGKRVVTSTIGGAAQEMGVRFQGLTPNMTMFSWHYASGSAHAVEGIRGGPYFEHIAFEDPAPKQYVATVQATGHTVVGTTVTLNIGAGHPFLVGNIIFVRDTYPSGGDISINGAWAVTAKTSTTVTFTTLVAPTGVPAAFGTVSYDTIPGITVKGVLLDGVSRFGFKRCSGSFLATFIDAVPTALASVNDGKVEACTSTYNNIGIRNAGGGEGAFTVTDSDFLVGSNQAGCDFVDGSGMRTRDNRFQIGADTSGQNAIGILHRAGTHFKYDGDRFEMDIRVGVGTGMMVGTVGRSVGDIIAPTVKAKHTDGRLAVGVNLAGQSSVNSVDSTTIHGGTYEGCLRSVVFGQFAIGNQLIGGGFYDYFQGVRLAVGATNNLLVGPSQGVTGAAGSVFISDQGTDTQWIGARDVGSGGKTSLRLATRAQPTTPPTGSVEVYPDSATGKMTVLKSDGTTASMEGGGGATGAMQLKATRITQLVLGIGDNNIAQWDVPAGYVNVGFALRFVFWGLTTTDANPQPAFQTQLSVGTIGNSRGATSHPLDVSIAGASWRCEGELIFKSFSGGALGTSNSNFTNSHLSYHAGISAANSSSLANRTKAVANASFTINSTGPGAGASIVGFSVVLVVNLSIAPAAGDTLTCEGAMLWGT